MASMLESSLDSEGGAREEEEGGTEGARLVRFGVEMKAKMVAVGRHTRRKEERGHKIPGNWVLEPRLAQPTRQA